MEIFRQKMDNIQRYSTSTVPTGWNRNYPNPLAQVSISTVRESARAYTSFLRHHDLPMTLEVFRPHGKILSILHGNIPESVLNRKFCPKWKAPPYLVYARMAPVASFPALCTSCIYTNAGQS